MSPLRVSEHLFDISNTITIYKNNSSFKKENLGKETWKNKNK
jgi:hypothetical protein